jgi:hypothetical protein
MSWPGWEGYVPPTSRQAAAPSPERPRREVTKIAPRVKGARVCWVNPFTREMSDVDMEGWERFHSRREANRWLALLADQDAGKVRNLRRQVAYPLNVRRPDGHEQSIATWTADFTYDETAGTLNGERVWIAVVEDSKGFRTEMYRRSRKHFMAQYGLTIRET